MFCFSSISGKPVYFSLAHDHGRCCGPLSSDADLDHVLSIKWQSPCLPRSLSAAASGKDGLKQLLTAVTSGGTDSVQKLMSAFAAAGDRLQQLSSSLTSTSANNLQARPCSKCSFASKSLGALLPAAGFL